MTSPSSNVDDNSDLTSLTQEPKTGGKDDDISLLDLSIDYLLTKSYPHNIDAKMKRSIRRRSSLLTFENGDILVRRKNRRVKVITNSTDRCRILEACHSAPTSGHFGVTKTRKKVSERFYWKGMMQQIKQLVSFYSLINDYSGLL